MPTAFEQAQDAATRIIAKLEEIDFKGLMNSTRAALDGISQLVNSPALKASLRGLEQSMPKLQEALIGVHQLTTSIDANMGTLSVNL